MRIPHALLSGVVNAALLAVLLLLLRAVILTTLERTQPASRVPYRDIWWQDASAWVACTFAIIPAATLLMTPITLRPVLPAAVLGFPLTLRFLLYLVVVDFVGYWEHRLMHTRYFWHMHRWHHAPRYIYWLGGVRASLVQQCVTTPAVIAAGALLDVAPWWMGAVIITKSTLQNDWMHLNVRWGHKWLEWILVTPRYHHIHHSDDPAHYRGNLSLLFTVWDRLFGTFVNPDQVPRNLSFGISERVPVSRLVLGL
jgi:sterol desaturase/sphingolipid hydroxylase (fatty acid hydroxylase superfamily)